MTVAHDFSTLTDLRDAIRAKKLSATDVVRHFLAQIESLDGELNCFREVYADRALERAAAIDRQLPDGPLAGVPIALKDNIVTSYGTTCAGSQILKGFHSPYDATVAQRLEAAGAIILGKTNCDEFAMGSSTEHCSYAQSRNPWDTDRVPGGSSGGSAAATSAGLCAAALGSDTGGSIRQPAAFCGCIGIKPTYGRVSRYGLIAFASTLDQIGPFTRTVRDSAALLDVICGHDPHDSTSANHPACCFEQSLEEPIKRPRIGIPRALLRDDNHPAVNKAVENAISVFTELGASFVDVELNLTDYGIATYYIIAPAEASSNLARFDGIRYGHRAELEAGESLFDLYAKSRAEGFGEEVQRRIMLGTYVLSAGYYDAYYKRALKIRRRIKQEYDAAFERCDVILGPTTPGPAFRAGEVTDPLDMYLCDYYTVGAPIAGIPAMSLPAGSTDVDGVTLPIGIHLQAQAFAEESMLRIAHAFEQATEFHKAQPPMLTK